MNGLPGSFHPNSEGYTLVELAVALAILLMLGGVLASSYLATARYVAAWQREVTLEDHTHLILQRLAADLTDAEQLIHAEHGTWTLTFASGRAVQYRYRDSTLTRNSRRMHAPGLAVVAFHLVPSRLETRYALRRREARRARNPVRVQIHLALQSPDRTLDVTTTVTLRLPRPWPPLP